MSNFEGDFFQVFLDVVEAIEGDSGADERSQSISRLVWITCIVNLDLLSVGEDLDIFHQEISTSNCFVS